MFRMLAMVRSGQVRKRGNVSRRLSGPDDEQAESLAKSCEGPEMFPLYFLLFLFRVFFFFFLDMFSLPFLRFFFPPIVVGDD